MIGIGRLRRGVALTIAWLGGALFVGSLLYFLYFYLVLLGTPRAERGAHPLPPLAINVALFALFGVHHSVMARHRAREWFARVAPAELERTVFVWTASLLLIVVATAWQPVPGTLYHVGGAWGWILYGAQATGIALTIRASGRLDVLELAGIRQVRRAGRERPSSAVGLEMSGPYRLVRHPVYLGWVLLVFGAPHMTADRFAFAAISTAYLAIAVRFEERALAQAFGESYREYARRVRWRFVPWLY
jgi:methanethiol S-methyltransferase